MSEAGSPDNKPIPPEFGNKLEKGPKSGVSDRQSGRTDRKPYPTRGADEVRPESISRRTQDSFNDAFTPKIEISDLLDTKTNSESLPDNHTIAVGSPIPISEGAYIYTRDLEDPSKLILVGVNTKFTNAKSVLQIVDPYAEEELEVESKFYKKDQSIKGRVRFFVIPNGKGKLKGSNE